MRSALYIGHLTHERRSPVHRLFRYRVFMWWIDTEELPAVKRRLSFGRLTRLFGTGPGHLVSIRSKDHFGDPACSIKENAAAFLATAGMTRPLGRVMLLCNGRLLGYVFDPLSLVYCYDTEDRLAAVIAEVHNTFGERHCYVIPGDSVMGHTVGKEFYVSPFLAVGGRYRMRVPTPGHTLRTTITLEQNGNDVFHSSLTGKRIPISRRSVLATLLAYPFLAFRITALIHWQAVQLWIRRVALVPRPHHARQERV
ncbi:MAG: DUF1365 domain-containing protein [Candidatus Dormibacteria bacterium]